MGREIVKLIRGALLSPLVIVFVLPVASLIEARIWHGIFDIDLTVWMIAPTLLFAYLEMLVFAAPMYLILRTTRRYFWLSMIIAGFAGFIAPFIVNHDFHDLFAAPFLVSVWLNSLTIAGAAVGVAFLFIARPGPNIDGLRQG
jgi:hypothetical protein